jgi:lipid II:glycine glycyltransferase (peptidoglycan interpeptide bridge formation enzyme)
MMMDLSDWNDLVLETPDPHLLQTRQWAELKSRYGWKPHYLVWNRVEGTVRHSRLGDLREDDLPDGAPAAAALVLEKRLPLGLRMMYAPKGPLLQDWDDPELRSRVIGDLVDFAQHAGAVVIKIDPDVTLGLGVPGGEDSREFEGGEAVKQFLDDSGWVFSPDQIQYRNTVLIDLTPDEEDLLMNMKSKTRYNIRLAGRKGVTVRTGDASDLDRLYTMYAKTSVRGGFTIRDQGYYRDLWQIFLPSSGAEPGEPTAEPLIAEVDGEPVAGAMMFRFGKTAYYLHGMSRSKHREKMPTYLIQWESMRWARQAGCEVYDMWGAPDHFHRDDPMWGVYRFKRGFGGQVRRTIGAWDYPIRPLLYQAYTRVWPEVLGLMRNFRDRITAGAAQSTGEPG